MTSRVSYKKINYGSEAALKKKPLEVEKLTKSDGVPRALGGFIDRIPDNILVETSFLLRRIKPKHTKDGDFDTLFYNHLKVLYEGQLKDSNPHISYSSFVIAGYQVAIANQEFLGTPFIEGLVEFLPRRANLVSELFGLYVTRLCNNMESSRL